MPRPLSTGEAAPWFRAPTLQGGKDFAFDSVGGYYVLLLFAGSASREPTEAALKALASRRGLFDDERACFFGVTIDPRDAATGRIAKQMPGIRWFLDYDGGVSQQFGAKDGDRYLPHWLLLDPMLRVVSRASITEGERILSQLQALLMQPAEELVAPVLVLPRVFEPEMCQRLIGLYEQDGGKPSGFMREVNGVTKGIFDQRFKRRSDFNVDDDQQLCEEIRQRLRTRLIPQIEKAFQFRVTRVERYIVACYDEKDAGFFGAHRDNTTAGTAHRRFACTINLNADDYDGGDLRFPEFGTRVYRAPTGGAAIFSCSMLHEATPVTRGKRYAFLPFFYDDAAAKVREANAGTDKVGADLKGYRA